MGGWRLGCIRIVEFVVHACLDTPDATALVVCVESRGHRYIRAVNHAVFEKGVRVGQTLNFAWSICPELMVVEWCRQRIDDCIKTVVQHLLQVSPTAQAMPGHDGCFMLDARGMSRLGGELAFAQRALKVCTSLGYADVRMGIASQWTVAWMSLEKTCVEKPVFRVPEADESAFARTFAIADLECDATVRDGLELLGVRTLGHLSALPRAAMIERFGVLIEPLFSLLDALEYQTPTQTREVNSPTVEWVLEQSVWSTDHLALGIRHLCVSLSCKLMEIAHQTSQVELRLGLDNKAYCDERIELTQPIIQAHVLQELVMGRLGSDRLRSLEAPIISVSLEAHRLTPLDGEQLRLASERWQPHKVDVLLDRLSALCERPVVHRALKLEGGDAASSYCWLPRERSQYSSLSGEQHERILPYLVRKRLPSPVRVEVRTNHENRPEQLRVAGVWHALTILARNRSSGGWWSQSAYTFEDFSVQLSSREMYWVRWVYSTDSWWLMGGWD